MDRTERHIYLALAAFPLLLIAAGCAVDSPVAILAGLRAIVRSHSLLLTDYLAVGGLGATLVNAGLCGVISVGLMAMNRIKVSGPFIAAVYTVIGFAFFGKNIINIWPLLGGVWLYTRYQGVDYRDYLIVALFGTTLAPLASFVAIGSEWPWGLAIPLGLCAGLAAGFVLPPLASHMLRFHDGYNIYNVGFTGGLIGSFLSAVLRSFGLTIQTGELISHDYSFFLGVLLNLSFLAMIAGGALNARNQWPQLRESGRAILNSSGRLVSDFVRIGGLAATVINMGVMGLLSSAFVLLLRGTFNGPVIGGILTVVGFAAFGKHFKNSLPILAGVCIAAYVTQWTPDSTPVIIAGLFGTTLAPIAGQYGIKAGLLAGFFHLSVVMNVGMLHGGMNLYNNGFAGGFVAAMLVPVMEALKRKEKSDEQ